MTNVVELPKRERGDLIWVCDCGCSTHRHYSDGRVECASCSAIGSVSSDGWRQLVAPTPTEPAEAVPDGSFAVYPIDTAETFMKRRIKEGAGIDAVIVLHDRGGPSTWAMRKATEDPGALRARAAVERMLCGKEA